MKTVVQFILDSAMVNIRYPVDDAERYWRNRMFQYCEEFANAAESSVMEQVFIFMY